MVLLESVFPSQAISASSWLHALQSRQLNPVSIRDLRGDHDFEPGNFIESQIRQYIHQANVFEGLHRRDHISILWCYHELASAVQLHVAQSSGSALEPG